MSCRARGKCGTAFKVTPQALEIGADVGGVLVAEIAVFFQSFIDDVARAQESTWDSAAIGAGARLRMASKITAGAFAREGQRAGRPSRRGPRRRKKDRCARPVFYRGPAPATYRR